jgi:hypothetical protein
VTRLRVGFALLAACGCTLIIDSQIDGVKVPDAGGSGDSGGPPDSGPGGTDSGGGGTDSGPGGDSGVLAPCDVNPRLRCDAPIVLGSGVVNAVRLATVNGNFLAAFASDGGIALRQVRSDGTVVASRTIQTSVVPPNLSVAGNGTHWALVWADPSANSDGFCTTDAMDGGTQVLDLTSLAGAGNGPYGLVNAGVSSDGGVAIMLGKRGDSSVYFGAGRSVCPTQYDFFNSGFDNGAEGVAAVSLNVPAPDDGWRYAFNMGAMIRIDQPNPDGGGVCEFFTNDSFNLQLPVPESAVASTTGSKVHVVVLGQPDSGQYELDAYAMDPNLFEQDQSPPRITLYPGTVDDFTSAACPASTPAIATAFIPAVTSGDISVAFMRDDPSEAPLGHGNYDVACHQNLAASTSSVSVACAGGRVGVLFSNNLSSSSQVQLYLCDLPF